MEKRLNAINQDKEKLEEELQTVKDGKGFKSLRDDAIKGAIIGLCLNFPFGAIWGAIM
eukprot:CAMPEP_0116943374 /NCGR_PEP_ID=MMETSP0467-20121206/35156_1 /TAXON_ID=283647 /ORGANISM="Mesodinium pulex, Strain SPMC105" /LENGTH=57 /DNA_ID=CAMNT_0004626557 /DNA_START=1184 /DNA_END=1357 /DNA_ORIENTATION=+